MKKLITKTSLYLLIFLFSLEILVRVFHLAKDTPTRFLDEHKVEKWLPNQSGYDVTGNRRQNFSEYHINNSGFNSYREFTPSSNIIEVAIIGDSFIEGFHQNYYNSIGKKIENKLNIEVYEYGYAGYDFADQLHLISAYQDQFDLIDHVILGIKFSNDLTRGEYHVVTSRLQLESPLNKILKKSKLLVHAKSIGLLDPPKLLIQNIINLISKPKNITSSAKDGDDKSNKAKQLELTYLNNFETLISKYNFNKEKFTLLLDSSITPSIFINYLNANGINYIDFSPSFEKTKKPTTLIYDRHWNNHGRTLISEVISSYLIQKGIVHSN